MSVFDSICIIVGIIIGVGIYETAPLVAASVGTGPATLAIWLVGGLIALAGALNYSELATTYPRQGGDYVYLTGAFGRGAGFLFGWTQLTVIRPGDIALMAFVFGRYASDLYPFRWGAVIYAAAAILILSILNILGVRQSKWTQNLLTVIKIAGLLIVVIAGLLSPYREPSTPLVTDTVDTAVPLALILVLFTFGGWNEMAYVAAEVKHPARNISGALVLGTLGVTVLYLLANAAFLKALGYANMAASEAVATETVSAVLSGHAGRFVSILVCVSALGAVNGLIFTGARVSYALGTEHRLFARLGHWNASFGTPVWALVLQAGLALAIVGFAGSFLDTLLYTAPVVWMFFLGTCLSVWILRKKDPQTPRPFKVPLYPVPTVIFAAACVFMLCSSINYAVRHRPIGLAIAAGCLVTGAIFYAASRPGKT